MKARERYTAGGAVASNVPQPCNGSYLRGNACGQCKRCIEELAMTDRRFIRAVEEAFTEEEATLP